MLESGRYGLLAVVPMLLLATIGRLTRGSWKEPGTFFALYWSVALGVPLLVAPEDVTSIRALFWIDAAVLVVFIGAGLRLKPPPEPLTGVHVSEKLLRRLRLAALGFTVLSIGGALFALYDAGFSVSILWSAQRLVEAANLFSVGRYSQTYRSPFLTQVLLPFLYAAPLFGGVLFLVARKQKNRVIAVATLFPALLITITQTQKAATIVAVVLFFSAYLSARIASGAYTLFSRKHVIAGMIALTASIIFFLAVSLARAGQSAFLASVSLAVPKVFVAAFGHLSAFSVWFETLRNTGDPPTLGAFSAAGLFDLLGLRTRIPGLFSELVMTQSGETTNIFTIFRPLIEDFTLWGSLLVLFIAGVVAGTAYRGVGRGEMKLFAVLVAFYSSVLYGPVTSIWVSNTITAAFFILAAFSFRIQLTPSPPSLPE